MRALGQHPVGEYQLKGITGRLLPVLGSNCTLGFKPLVALIPMGMAQVSSVNFEGNVRPGITHKKGVMLGNFLFGGSDFVMLFQEKAGFEITAPKTDKTATKSDPDQNTEDMYKHILVGEKYGVMKGQTK